MKEEWKWKVECENEVDGNDGKKDDDVWKCVIE